jgi:hypothetical protein
MTTFYGGPQLGVSILNPLEQNMKTFVGLALALTLCEPSGFANPLQRSSQTKQTWLHPGDTALMKTSAAGFAETASAKHLLYGTAEVQSRGMWSSTRTVELFVQPPLACAYELGQLQAANLNPAPTMEMVRGICDGRINILVVEHTTSMDERWKIIVEIGSERHVCLEVDPELPKASAYLVPDKFVSNEKIEPTQHNPALTKHSAHHVVGYEYSRVFNFYPETVEAVKKITIQYTDGQTPTSDEINVQSFVDDELRQLR